MFKGFINYDEYINDTIHRVLFDFETGDVIVASKNFEETKAKGAKDINFNTFFPNYIYKDIKDKVVKAKEGHIMTTLEYRGQKMPFKFELIEFEDKQTIAGSLIVDGLTLGSFREKFNARRGTDFFMTVYLDKNYNIVACSRKYKEVFQHSSKKIIGNNIMHNILNHIPGVGPEYISRIIKKHRFWYGVVVLKERDNIFEPYIIVAYVRKVPAIKVEYEVHFFPLSFFGMGNIFQNHFHSDNHSIYSRSVFEAIVRKYLTADDNDKYLLFMDINNFKSINDTHGHVVGDKVLKTLSNILSEVFKDYVISSYGGDEFAVYIDKHTTKEEIIEMIHKVEKGIKKEIGYMFNQGRTHLSFGVSKYKDNGTTLNELIHAADMAMYRAKKDKSLCEFCYE